MSLPNAITREDFYLNKIANPSDDHELPDAITRTQKYLKAIAENGGGGGGGIERTLLWQGDLTTVNSPVTLSEAITNFDQIQIVYSFNSDSTLYRKCAIYPKDAILVGTAANLQEGVYYESSHYVFGAFSFPTSTSFIIDESFVSGWGLHVLAIYGIN